MSIVEEDGFIANVHAQDFVKAYPTPAVTPYLDRSKILGFKKRIRLDRGFIKEPTTQLKLVVVL